MRISLSSGLSFALDRRSLIRGVGVTENGVGKRVTIGLRGTDLSVTLHSFADTVTVSVAPPAIAESPALQHGHPPIQANLWISDRNGSQTRIGLRL